MVEVVFCSFFFARISIKYKHSDVIRHSQQRSNAARLYSIKLGFDRRTHEETENNRWWVFLLFPPKQYIFQSPFSYINTIFYFDDELNTLTHTHTRIYCTRSASFLFSFLVSHGYFPVRCVDSASTYFHFHTYSDAILHIVII